MIYRWRGGATGFPIMFGQMPFSDQLSHLSTHNYVQTKCQDKKGVCLLGRKVRTA